MSLLEKLKLPCRFTLSEGDQQLVFDRNNPEEIRLFLTCTNKKKEIILKEVFDTAILEAENTMAADRFIKQYTAFIYPDTPIVFPAAKPPGAKSHPQRKFLPGSEWLYLKIYTPKISTDRLLIKLLPLLKKRYQHEIIKKWFFVRYEDHAPHLRLRLQVNPGDIQQILSTFQAKLETGINEHVIREYQIDVYSRELERYDAAPPELTENHFHASSKLAAAFLIARSKSSALALFPLALCTVRDLIAIFITDKDQQIAFCYANYERFSLEFATEGLRVGLDKQYRKLYPQFHFEMADSRYYKKIGLNTHASQFRISAAKLNTFVLRKQNAFQTLLESIIHMHLNRFFSEDARKQEMVVYYFLYKYLVSEKGRSKNLRLLES